MKYAQETIADFLKGGLEIREFRRLYDERPEIDAFLQKIIDDMKKDPDGEIKKFPMEIMGTEQPYVEAVPYLLAPESDPGLRYGCPPRYQSVRQCLTYELHMTTHDVETASGALDFYTELYSIYYQWDQSIPYEYMYREAYRFSLDVIPEYLSGGASERYIQKYIIPLFPEAMKKTERKKAIKARIKEAFKSEKGYPCWPQASEWPMDREGKPCTYLGKGKSNGDIRRFLFRDEATGEIITVEQLL